MNTFLVTLVVTFLLVNILITFTLSSFNLFPHPLSTASFFSVSHFNDICFRERRYRFYGDVANGVIFGHLDDDIWDKRIETMEGWK